MEIEFVNHASFIARSAGVSLICDPWIEGTAFNDGWALISPTRFAYEDFAHVTHMWFSHEHPDHFSPPNLRKIPEARRRNIRVLYQKTGDRKVVDYCAKAGFLDVEELSFGRWITLAPDFAVLCGPAPHGDSWMAIRSAGKTLLNLNDCAIFSPEAAEPVRRLVGPVDVVATQFSLSAWEGNPEETERRSAGARTMLERCLLHASFFGPKYVIPFASYIWFCHEENFFMNAQHNRIDRVAHAIRARTSSVPVVMYPGDVWTVGQPFDSEAGIARHVADFESLPGRQRAQAKVPSEKELVDAADKFRSSLAERASRTRLDIGFARGHVARAFRRLLKGVHLGEVLALAKALFILRPPPVRIYLWDRAQGYLFDLRHGLRSARLRRERCQVCCSSDSLVYAFKFLWGGMSLQVNGRFHEVYPGGREPLFDYFHLAESFNRGEPLVRGSIFKRLARALKLG
jgi:UDP-MurNAc hydroxylase